ncbi:cytochrome P450 monooxygenase, putative [Metarhizium acridum CQMa 102]|uniref:Cytochrome P450 monooxygenase, putative n=1 Tax=Metarhizium acridum (strain CQMa 102) TaxID=655827 RepID=E9DWC2_METAQ|nr:cytochrome P450 monooxygenase, putative [Metarhizium acridum CQMa 102]EFY91972.1 cytochrome P450 monooxygenase, putative [Metarhizium acridum CQMa 102]
MDKQDFAKVIPITLCSRAEEPGGLNVGSVNGALVYALLFAIYRLYFSPIAAFPGPFLAKVTHWYEFYYHSVCTGMYYEKIREMHCRFGPVVRVTPEEVQVLDPSAYHKLFVTGAAQELSARRCFNEQWYEILKIVNSDLVERELGNGVFARLAHLIQQAGSFNVSHTLSTVIVYLLLGQKKLEPLRKELGVIWARYDGNKGQPSWVELEKAPYLSACGMNRTPRVFPHDDNEVCAWLLPKGTPISMSTYWMHNDPVVFPNPESFEPDRWINNSPEELTAMRAYFVPFEKGSRACLGQNCSHLRPGMPNLTLYDTMPRDVIAAIHGLLFAMPPIDSKGVKVTIS